MNPVTEGLVLIDSELDIVTIRKTARQACMSIGFGATDITRIVTAVSELARNIYSYAGKGMMRWHVLTKEGKRGLEFQFIDQGPGIQDIAKAMQPGYTTSRGLGMGLPGSKRLMDEMTVVSEVEKGTQVTIRKWLN